MDTEDITYKFKVVLLGEGAVGKTSIVLRYVEDKFNEMHQSTIQASYVTKKVNINGNRIHLAIWDTAGQEKFHALGPIYYRMSNGAILVYDITDVDSFIKVKCWVKELRKMLGSGISLIIAGNKTDLEKDRHVTVEEAEQYAKEVNAKHVMVSAKLNKGVENLFLQLCKSMIEEALKEKAKKDSLNRSASLGRNVVIVDDSIESEETESRSGSGGSSRSRCCTSG